MDTTTFSLIIAVVALIVAIAAFLKKPAKQETPAAATISKESATLKLQAYERLVLLTERIALPNLISRLNQPGISAYEMKLMLIENVKAEFDYNSTQQLYVTPVCWDAVRNLKEQNIMIINKVAAMLPPTASAQDLNKQLLELLMAQPNSSLHEMVLQALNYEAQKLMQ
jgi:hypothetical protein